MLLQPSVGSVRSARIYTLCQPARSCIYRSIWTYGSQGHDEVNWGDLPEMKLTRKGQGPPRPISPRSPVPQPPTFKLVPFGEPRHLTIASTAHVRAFADSFVDLDEKEDGYSLLDRMCDDWSSRITR